METFIIKAAQLILSLSILVFLHGHIVYIQEGAGANSGFSDDLYLKVGATLLPSIEEVYAASEMIVKVKEPIEPEYRLIKKGQLLFTYFHFASNPKLTKAMIDSGAVCLAYETVEKADRSLPLLIPMSEVAGRMSIQEGAKYLERPNGGKGILLGGVPGVKPAKVLVLGGGVVGTQAAWMAAGLGADVTLADISLPRLRYLADVLPHNVKTLVSSDYVIAEEVKSADLVIGAVLVTGAKTPHLVTAAMVLLDIRNGYRSVYPFVQEKKRIAVCSLSLALPESAISYLVDNMRPLVLFDSKSLIVDVKILNLISSLINSSSLRLKILRNRIYKTTDMLIIWRNGYNSLHIFIRKCEQRYYF